MRKTIHSAPGELAREALTKIRERSGLTQRELCRRLGREHSFVSKCELGERRVDMVEFYWICKACGANPGVEARKLMKAFAELEKHSNGD